MADLKCPFPESTKYLCDREAAYSLDGAVYCHIHARRLIGQKLAAYGVGLGVTHA